jgi:hypothetical protein
MLNFYKGQHTKEIKLRNILTGGNLALYFFFFEGILIFEAVELVFSPKINLFTISFTSTFVFFNHLKIVLFSSYYIYTFLFFVFPSVLLLTVCQLVLNWARVARER